MNQIPQFGMHVNVSAVARRFTKRNDDIATIESRRAMSSLVAWLLVAGIVVAIVVTGFFVIHTPQTQAVSTTQQEYQSSQSSPPQAVTNGSVLTNQPGGNGNLTGVCNNVSNYYYSYYC
jgi:uncharacterized membrane protein YciS (DUF1049 family)